MDVSVRGLTTTLFDWITARWRAVERCRKSERAQTGAEPSLEGPVGKTTGNRPLINQFQVNPAVAFQNAGSALGLVPNLRLQVFPYQPARNRAWGLCPRLLRAPATQGAVPHTY